MCLDSFPRLLPSGAAVPILRVVLPSPSLSILKPQPDQVPGKHRLHSVLESLSPLDPVRPKGINRTQWPTCQGCSPGLWPAGRPSSPGAYRLALAGIPLAPPLLSTQHSASDILSGPGLSELSSGFIFGRSGILSPYLLSSFREGVGPPGSAGD